MKITIHRGSNQIGGSITEIESGGYKVFIDFGEQLPGAEIKELKPIEGLSTGDISKSALFITHYHRDHIGKIIETMPELPIYIGKTAIEIFNFLERRLSYIQDPIESEKHKKNIDRIKTAKTFVQLDKVKIGNITVTPLLIDHSAFDAYMFIIEAENRRILHTGDFRAHGFRGKGLIPMLKSYAKNIDYIISEGSNILRPDVKMKPEQELKNEFETQFKNNKYNFVLLSSTNIDRIFAIYHASKKAKRCFVCDSYQAGIMKIVTKNHKKFTKFYNIDYTQKDNYAGRFFEMKRQGLKPISFNEKLKKYLNKYGFCMLIRSSEAFRSLLDEYYGLKETKIYYSMWDGYLDSSKTAYNETLNNFLKTYEYKKMHTSGHADLETLKAVFKTVKPRYGVIPIHTEAPEKFRELFSGLTSIIHLQDGEVFDCIANRIYH